MMSTCGGLPAASGGTATGRDLARKRAWCAAQERCVRTRYHGRELDRRQRAPGRPPIAGAQGGPFAAREHPEIGDQNMAVQVGLPGCVAAVLKVGCDCACDGSAPARRGRPRRAQMGGLDVTQDVRYRDPVGFDQGLRSLDHRRRQHGKRLGCREGEVPAGPPPRRLPTWQEAGLPWVAPFQYGGQVPPVDRPFQPQEPPSRAPSIGPVPGPGSSSRPPLAQSASPRACKFSSAQ